MDTVGVRFSSAGRIAQSFVPMLNMSKTGQSGR